MTPRSTATPPTALARPAGLLYLLIIVCGIFAEIFVRSRLLVAGDAGATAANILAAEPLFRLGFAADSIMLLCDVAVAVLLYLLLRPVGPALALVAAALRLAQAAVLGANLLNYHAALLLLTGGEYAASLDADELRALALLRLEMHAYGNDLGLLFFGLSNLVLGYLVARSGYFPALLGYGLAAAGLVYLAGSYIRFLFPGGFAAFEPLYIVPLVAELAFCLWLLIRGVGGGQAEAGTRAGA